MFSAVTILQDIAKVWKDSMDSFEIEMLELLKENNLFITIAKV
jgi:hypothetical protein